jgi:hypothetical protein
MAVSVGSDAVSKTRLAAAVREVSATEAALMVTFAGEGSVAGAE